MIVSLVFPSLISGFYSLQGEKCQEKRQEEKRRGRETLCCSAIRHAVVLHFLLFSLMLYYAVLCNSPRYSTSHSFLQYFLLGSTPSCFALRTLLCSFLLFWVFISASLRITNYPSLLPPLPRPILLCLVSCRAAFLYIFWWRVERIITSHYFIWRWWWWWR